MKCANALYKEYSPCREKISEYCAKSLCNYEEIYDCYKYIEQVASGMKKRCENKVLKICSKCNINMTNIECYKEDIECNAEVTGSLVCDHSNTWICGVNDDPRLMNVLECCLACVIPLWDNEIKTIITKPNRQAIKSFQDMSTHKILETLENISVISKDLLEVSIETYHKHMDSRNIINKVFVDVLRKDDIILSLPPPAIGAVNDMDNYDLVFQKIPVGNNNEKKMIVNFSKNTDTRYGLGNRLLLLTDDNLKKQKACEDGLIHIIVGVAYKHKCLEITPQFRIDDNPPSKNKANKSMEMNKKKGYDCVDVYNPNKEVENSVSARVYWHPFVATPMMNITFKLHINCMVCFDHFTEKEGLRCSKGHLVCWECFVPYAKSAGEPDAIGRSIDKEGNLKCPCTDCDQRYTTENVAQSGGKIEVYE
jgi:hypothetical protein